MAEPEPTNLLLQYLQYVLAAAATIGTAIGAAFTAMKLRRRLNGGVTALDLERLHRKIKEEAEDERHDRIYPTIHKVSIENERDLALVEKRVDLVAVNGATEIKRVEQMISEFANNIDVRLTKIESNIAVLKDRSDRQEKKDLARESGDD